MPGAPTTGPPPGQPRASRQQRRTQVPERFLVSKSGQVRSRFCCQSHRSNAHSAWLDLVRSFPNRIALSIQRRTLSSISARGCSSTMKNRSRYSFRFRHIVRMVLASSPFSGKVRTSCVHNQEVWRSEVSKPLFSSTWYPLSLAAFHSVDNGDCRGVRSPTATAAGGFVACCRVSRDQGTASKRWASRFHRTL